MVDGSEAVEASHHCNQQNIYCSDQKVIWNLKSYQKENSDQIPCRLGVAFDASEIITSNRKTQMFAIICSRKKWPWHSLPALLCRCQQIYQVPRIQLHISNTLVSDTVLLSVSWNKGLKNVTQVCHDSMPNVCNYYVNILIKIAHDGHLPASCCEHTSTQELPLRGISQCSIILTSE